MRLSPLAVVAALVTVALAGCVDPGEEQPRVLADVDPTQYLVDRLLGGAVQVGGIVPEGQDPHTWEPSPRDATRVADAEVLVVSAASADTWLPRLLAALGDEAPPVVHVYRNVSLLPLAEAHHEAHGDGEHEDHDDHAAADGHDDEGEHDPHIWFDPVRMANATPVLAEDLAAVLPDHAATIQGNVDAVVADLTALHADHETALASCEERTLIVTHNALAYFSDRYNVSVRAFTGALSEGEPSPGAVAQIVEEAREHGISIVFYEGVQGKRAMEAVAREIDGEARLLHTIEASTPAEGGDYPTLMRANLDNFKAAMRCGEA